MAENMQICKQCGLTLPVDEFRQYPSRSEGIRRTSTGRYTICKHCEKMSAYAAKLNKLIESGKATDGDHAEHAALVDYYKDLVDRGLPLVTKPVRVLLGVDDEPKGRRGASKVMSAIAEARRRMDAANTVANSVEADVAKFKTFVDDTLDKAVARVVDNVVDIKHAVSTLNELYSCELTREPAYYEQLCDKALHVLRATNSDGKVPPEYAPLASEVLERLDDYADSYTD